MKYANTTLVTGAAGFIGQELVRQLHKNKIKVRATDIHQPIGRDFQNSGIEFIQANLCDPLQASALFQDVDRVFHCAGICNLTAPYHALEPINVKGVALIADFALEHKVRCFVHMSSTSVYGTYQGSPFNEGNECKPKDDYGRSKLAGEAQIIQRMAQGLSAIILRPCTVYGPGCNDGAGKVFSRPGTIAGIPGNGRQRLANIRVEDVAAAAIFVSETENAIGKTFNLADDSHPQLEEALVMAAEAFGSTISRKHIPLALLKVLARMEGIIAKLRHEIPDLEYQAIKYLYQDYVIDNRRLTKTGYQLLYPDFRTSMRDLATRIIPKI